MLEGVRNAAEQALKTIDGAVGVDPLDMSQSVQVCPLLLLGIVSKVSIYRISNIKLSIYRISIYRNIELSILTYKYTFDISIHRNIELLIYRYVEILCVSYRTRFAFHPLIYRKNIIGFSRCR